MSALISVSLPDGSVHQFPQGLTIAAAVAQLDPALAQRALAAQVDGQVLDLSRPLLRDCALQVLTFADAQGRVVFRHSSTHLLAQAVKRLFPAAQLTVGPALADGFYYDIDVPRPVTPADLAAIEAEMVRIVSADLPIVRAETDRAAAKAFFAQRGESYKVLLVDKIPAGEPISLYSQGEFVDLCAGPHIPSTGRIQVVKLLSVAGAYWEGNQANKQLQRIYGTSFEQAVDLQAYLHNLEEAKRRDHRKLGPEQNLFLFRPEEAPGFAFWLPKGWRVFRTLENWSRELQERRGYEEVRTPWIYSEKLYSISGHWQHFKDNMFCIESEGHDFGTKPMNCPGHCLIYKSERRSYRDLPLKLSEYGPISRNEGSGGLHGLLRVRGFHQDDAHLFVRPDQIVDQVHEVTALIDEMYSALGIHDVHIKLATRPESYTGDPAVWEQAEAILASALNAVGRSYEINPGEGAFYGPKLEFYIIDALGRPWQCATVQLDFNFPQLFDLTYVAADGSEQRPVMIHRAVMGSIERFVGILTEHFAGAFPLWLAPVQVRLLPIADRHRPYADAVLAALRTAGVRAELDDSPNKVGYKIRQAEVAKIPFALVVGDKEVAADAVSVRRRGMHDLGALPLADFIALVVQEDINKHQDESCRRAVAGATAIAEE